MGIAEDQQEAYQAFKAQYAVGHRCTPFSAARFSRHDSARTRNKSNAPQPAVMLSLHCACPTALQAD